MALALVGAAALTRCAAVTDTSTRPARYGTDAGAVAASDEPEAPADRPEVDTSPTIPDVPPRFDPNASCTTGRMWTRGDQGRTLMNPGGSCLACHTRERENTEITLGGTLYYAPHELDGCIGFTGDPPGSNQGSVVVRLIDANGVESRLRPNASGNFSSTARFAFPLRLAEVIGPNGATNAMSAAVPHGDCNACHTREGVTTPTGEAPGRILIP